MSIWNKLLTAVRGGATEVGEAIVDTQALRILDQEMRDARKHLDQAKQSLTGVMAEKMGVDRKVKQLAASVTEHEGYAIKAMEAGNDALALEVANKIAEISEELDAQQKLLDGYNSNVSQLKKTINETERNVRAMEREVSVVKTTEAVNKANAAAAAKFSGSNSSMRSATDSLERIKAKQQKRQDQMQAAMELQNEGSGADLSAKLKEAGIVSGAASGNSILERLKAKQQAGG